MENMQIAVDKIQADVKSLATVVESLRVVDDESNTRAAELLGAVKERAKKIEELRTKLVKPLNDHVKTINNTFKVESAPLEEYETKIKAEMKNYFLFQKKKAEEEAEKQRKAFYEAEQARIKERERLLEEQKNAPLEGQTELEELIEAASVPTVQMEVEDTERTVRAGSTTVSMKTVWKYEIVDMPTLMTAHPDFFVPDGKKIQEYIMNIREEKEVDGIKIFQDTVIASR